MPQYSTFFNLKKAADGKLLEDKLFQEKVRLRDFLESKIFISLVKVLALLLMLYFIQQKIVEGRLSFDAIGVMGKALWEKENAHFLLIPIFLVPLNWGLEAKKWQLLTRPVIKLSLFQASRAVLTGLGLGFITPRSLGDYAGRILEVPRVDTPRVDTPRVDTPVVKREGLVGAVILNRLSQSLITNLTGLFGLVVIFVTNPPEDYRIWIWVCPLLVTGVGAGIFVLMNGRKSLVKLAGKFAIMQPVLKLIRIMADYSAREIDLLVLFAFLRYCVFSLQFVLVLWLAGVELPAHALFAGVAVVFMVKSVIPAFNFLSDLGVREFSALLVFSVYQVPENQLIVASMLVWCLNILLPTLLGGINILRLRSNSLV